MSSQRQPALHVLRLLRCTIVSVSARFVICSAIETESALLVVLATKDLLQVNQEEPYGRIDIRII